MNWAAIEGAIQAWIVTGSGLAADHVIWAEQRRAPRPSTPFIAINKTTLLRRGQDWADVEDNLLTVADTVDAVDFANNELDIATHGLVTGDGPVRLATTGTLPTGLALLTDYWVVAATVDAISLATSLVNSHVPTLVAFSDVGSGTHTIASTSETARNGEEIDQVVRGARTLNLSIQCYGLDSAANAPVGNGSPVAILNEVVTAIAFPSVRLALNLAGVGIGRFDSVTSIGAQLGPAEWEPRAVVNAVIFLSQETSETGTYIESIEDPERI